MGIRRYVGELEKDLEELRDRVEDLEAIVGKMQCVGVSEYQCGEVGTASPRDKVTAYQLHREAGPGTGGYIDPSLTWTETQAKLRGTPPPPLGYDRNGTPVWEGDKVNNVYGKVSDYMIVHGMSIGGVCFTHGDTGWPRTECILYQCGPNHPKAGAR